jgi:hypothetical protein
MPNYMSDTDSDQLDAMVRRVGLAAVLTELAAICDSRADVCANNEEYAMAERWGGASADLETIARRPDLPPANPNESRTA